MVLKPKIQDGGVKVMAGMGFVLARESLRNKWRGTWWSGYQRGSTDDRWS